jgi:hypothetical protein
MRQPALGALGRMAAFDLRKDVMRQKAEKRLQEIPTQPQEISLQAAQPNLQAIAEAAYYRAERRGFHPGSEIDDWLAAEEELRKQEQRQA